MTKPPPEPPATIDVGPHTYRVVVDHDRLMEGDRAGGCSRDRLTIAIDPTLPHTQTADTLLHEVIHACLGSVQISIDAAEQERVEELVALALGTNLLDVLRANPDLVAFLVA